jgi:DNA modification methylase
MLFEDLDAVAHCLQFDIGVGRRLVPALVPEDRGDGAVRSARKYSHLWNGFNKPFESGQRRVHPTQKPVALMKWCIALAGNPQSILNPYLGSGTTLCTAKDLAIKWIWKNS